MATAELPGPAPVDTQQSQAIITKEDNADTESQALTINDNNLTQTQTNQVLYSASSQP